MNCPRSLWGLVLAGSLLAFAGCGSNPPAAPVVQPTANASLLAGNWLITGNIPFFGSPPPAALGLAMTIDVNGTQVLARESDSVPCPGGGFIGGAGGSVAGTISSTGGFSVQSVVPVTVPPFGPLPNLQITGTAPATSQGQWSGTYSYTPGSTTCGQTLSGAFTATPIQNLNGTFSGTTSLGKLPLGSVPSAPITVQITVQQGAMVTPATGTAYYKASALTGTVSVVGSPCFAHGTTTVLSGVPTASTAGSFVDLNFKMDDGSQLIVAGFLTKTDATTFHTISLTIRGGTCDGENSTAPFDFSR